MCNRTNTSSWPARSGRARRWRDCRVASLGRACAERIMVRQNKEVRRFCKNAATIMDMEGAVSGKLKTHFRTSPSQVCVVVHGTALPRPRPIPTPPSTPSPSPPCSAVLAQAAPPRPPAPLHRPRPAPPTWPAPFPVPACSSLHRTCIHGLGVLVVGLSPSPAAHAWW